MGITFVDTEKKFVFDFEHDGAEDIVSLTVLLAMAIR